MASSKLIRSQLVSILNQSYFINSENSLILKFLYLLLSLITKTTNSIWDLLTSGMGTISSHITHLPFFSLLPALVHFGIVQGSIPKLIYPETIGLGFLDTKFIDVGKVAIVLSYVFNANFGFLAIGFVQSILAPLTASLVITKEKAPARKAGKNKTSAK